MENINIYCWKCGKYHTLADNGWSRVLCTSCKAVMLNPKEAAEQSVETDEGDSTAEEEVTNPYLLSGEELERTEALRRSRKSVRQTYGRY